MIQCILFVTITELDYLWMVEFSDYNVSILQYMVCQCSMAMNDKIPEFISLSAESILAVSKVNRNSKHIRAKFLNDNFATSSNFLWSCVIADKCKTHEENLDSARRRIIEYEEHQRLHETERRKLHNTIQELKVLCCLIIIDDDVKRPNHEFGFLKPACCNPCVTLPCHSNIKC